MKNFYKRLFSLILAFVLLPSPVGVLAIEEKPIQFALSSAEARVGDIVEVRLSVTGNTLGFNSFTLNVKYDKDYLKIISCDLLPTSDMVFFTPVPNYRDDTVRVIYNKLGSDFSSVGEIVSYKFEITGAPQQTTVSPLSLHIEEVFNRTGEVTSSSGTTDGAVTIISDNPKHTVTVNAGSGGTAIGGGEYEEGRSVTLTATPNEGYSFDGWYEYGVKVSGNAVYDFEATANRTLEARFSENTVYYMITATATAGGTVSGDGSYEEGDSVTLTATPSSGYSFVGWYENDVKISGAAATYSFTATINRTVEARFIKDIGYYTITATAGTGGTVSGGRSYAEGDSVTLTATPNSGYSFAGWYENGGKVPGAEATYTFTATTVRTLEARFISLSDITPPTGKITIGTHGWNSFMNFISFGLFAKETQTVTITAEDDSGESVTIQYYLSAEELTLPQALAVTDWTDYTNALTINPNRKFIVYAKLTDPAGNETIINSDGIVLYHDAEDVTESISFTKNSGDDQTVIVTTNGNTIQKITNGVATLIRGTDYTVSDGTITIKVSYLEHLAAGDYTLTVYYNPLGVEYPESPLNGSVAPAVTTIALAVNNAPTFSISASPLALFGSLQTPYTQPAAQTVTVTNTGTGSVTLTQPAATDYEISTLSTMTLAANGATATFTVRPKAGLSVGNHDETIIINGSNGASTTVNASFTVTAAPVKTASVSTQTGALTAGTAGSATFTATTENIANGSTIVLNGAPVGVTLSLVITTGNSTEITINTTAAVAEGTYPLTITADGVTSNSFNLYVASSGEIPVASVTVSGAGSATTITTNGGTLQMSAAVLPLNATNTDVTWSVTNGTGTASISASGLLTAATNGTVTVKATANDGSGVYGELEITISGQTTPPPPWHNPYSDVATADWFYDAVRFVTEEGLMIGTSGGKFSPHVTTNRAMIVTILWRLEGEPDVEGMYANFADVVQKSWYETAVGWAAKNEIVLGYPGGFFKPDNPVTREEAVTILFRYAKYKGLDVSARDGLAKFTDVDAISDWALDAMKWAVAEGIVQGRTATTTVPQGISNRAEIAMIFKRYIEDFWG